MQQSNHFPKVYFHAQGTSQDSDTLIYERPDQKEWGLNAGVSEDGRYLLIYVRQGTDRRNGLFYKRLIPPAPNSGGAGIGAGAGPERPVRVGAGSPRPLVAKNAAGQEGAASSAPTGLNPTPPLLGAGGTPTPIIELFGPGEAAYSFLGGDGDTFWLRTDRDAPRGRVVAVDVPKTRIRRPLADAHPPSGRDS